ncbi:MAG: NAD(P)-dependent oxidoreductase [Gaiellaceae bacterium]
MTNIFIPDTEAAERMAMGRRMSALPEVSVRLGERFSTPASELVASIGDAEVLCVALARVDPAVIAAAPHLRLVVKCGIGTENIDLDSARQHRVGVVRTAGVNVHGAAEYVIAAALLHGRRLAALDVDVREHRWSEARLEWAGRISSLSGKTIGIVGLGAIGRKTAELAFAHGMRVLASDPFADTAAAAAHGVELTNLEQLLAESDVVTVHVVLDSSTHHLFGAKEFRAMKPTALFVNAARGGVVNTGALVEALQAGAIAHAVVDVLEEEPAADDHPLLLVENCTLTPHIAGCTDQGYDEIGTLAADLVRRFLTDEPLPPACVVVPPSAP